MVIFPLLSNPGDHIVHDIKGIPMMLFSGKPLSKAHQWFFRWLWLLYSLVLTLQYQFPCYFWLKITVAKESLSPGTSVLMTDTLIDKLSEWLRVRQINDTGGSHLSWIFWEHENLSASASIYIKLCKEKDWQKIQAKWESGLTTVWLKWDPHVLTDRYSQLHL